MRANGVAWGSFKGVTGNGAGEQSSPRKPFPMSEMVTRGTRDTSTSSGSRPCHWKRGKDRVTKVVEVLSCHRGGVSRWDCAGLLVTTGGDLSFDGWSPGVATCLFSLILPIIDSSPLLPYCHFVESGSVLT